MMIRIESVITCGLLLLILATGFTPEKPCLCKANEVNLYSFSGMKSKKILSVCIEKDEKYIVYRFGTSEKTELQYPDKLDETSWAKFTYRGYTRGGGAMNAAIGAHSLSFSNNNVIYEIHEEWGYEDNTEESYSRSSGITIEANGKATKIIANPQTESGSLTSLMINEKLENKFYE